MVIIGQRSSHEEKTLPEGKLWRRNSQSASSASSFAEMAGGTTAVACLAPYSVANLVVLAAYKAPTDLYHKTVRERRRRRLIRSGLMHTRSLSVDAELFSLPALVPPPEEEAVPEKELLELEKQMWERFSGTGFWRSLSKKEREMRDPDSDLVLPV